MSTKQALALTVIAASLALVSGSRAVTADAPTAPRFSDAKYAAISARRLETLQTLRDGKFDALDAQLTALQDAYEKGNGDDFAVMTAFAPFTSAGEDAAAPLERWVAKSPKSFAAHLARAKYLRHTWHRYSDAQKSRAEAALGQAAVDALAKHAVDEYRESLTLRPRLPTAYTDLIELGLSSGDRAV